MRCWAECVGRSNRFGRQPPGQLQVEFRRLELFLGGEARETLLQFKIQLKHRVCRADRGPSTFGPEDREPSSPQRTEPRQSADQSGAGNWHDSRSLGSTQIPLQYAGILPIFQQRFFVNNVKRNFEMRDSGDSQSLVTFKRFHDEDIRRTPSEVCG